jgi:hypothetical protein
MQVERYSSAVNSLEKLLNWWYSLSEVQKASRESIAHLVLEAEAVISQEQRSWTATASKTGDGSAVEKPTKEEDMERAITALV